MPEEKKLKILICLLTTYERSGWVSKHLTEWLENLRFQNKYYTSVAYAHNFYPAAAARNYFCKTARELPIEDRPDWLLMIDNDMAPPENLLDTIQGAPADASVVVPRFYMWNPDKATVVLCWGLNPDQARVDSEGAEVLDMTMGKYYELTKAGTGAMFIKPDMLDQLSMPYFWYDYDPEMHSSKGTEDINFCKKVREAGGKIYGFTDIEVGHFHNVDLALLARYLYRVKQAEQEPAEVWR